MSLTDPRLFPAILITLDCMAGVRYALDLDWKRSIYWFAAAILTLMVTL
jgi:hypothetical protein